MKQKEFQNAIRILSGETPPRVWSLIVTVFGDLAQDAEQSISGPVLGDILAPLGVRPEAMRVALHRLRADGWIETEKRGREALHRLSASGRAESAQAGGVIYASARPAEDGWHMLCYPTTQSADAQARAADLQARGYIEVAPGAYLANGLLQGDANDALVMQGMLEGVPEWLGGRLVPPALISGFKDLSAALDLFAADASDQARAEPLQIAALRTIIVHRWRKLVLRLPLVPDTLFGPNWEGGACRARVTAHLDSLPRPDVSAL